MPNVCARASSLFFPFRLNGITHGCCLHTKHQGKPKFRSRNQQQSSLIQINASRPSPLGPPFSLVHCPLEAAAPFDSPQPSPLNLLGPGCHAITWRGSGAPDRRAKEPWPPKKLWKPAKSTVRRWATLRTSPHRGDGGPCGHALCEAPPREGSPRLRERQRHSRLCAGPARPLRQSGPTLRSAARAGPCGRPGASESGLCPSPGQTLR
jgi:hypothetical protein